MYPKITSPCPFKFSAMPSGEKNYCGHCQKTVHNLDGMCANARKTFLANRSGKVCVAYSLPRTVATLGAGIALSVALSTSATAYAQDNVQSAQDEELQDIIIVGGTVASDTEWAEARDIQPLPALEADAPALEFVRVSAQ
jgi:hypothetical protein